MSLMQAKVQVSNVLSSTTSESVQMFPVCNKPFGPNGESEDNTYARWTPSGEITLSITNPALLGKFKQGQKFYVTFTEAEA